MVQGADGRWRMPHIGELCCKRPALADTLDKSEPHAMLCDALFRSAWNKPCGGWSLQQPVSSISMLVHICSASRPVGIMKPLHIVYHTVCCTELDGGLQLVPSSERRVSCIMFAVMLLQSPAKELPIYPTLVLLLPWPLSWQQQVASSLPMTLWTTNQQGGSLSRFRWETGVNTAAQQLQQTHTVHHRA